MKMLYFAFLAATAAPVFAQQDKGQEIVVTGTRLKDSERALAECLKRKCPPEEDINASLAHAENLFVAGAYKDARMTAKASIGRNARHAKGFPVPVSDLYRANSRISAHLGEGGDYESSTWGIKRALRAGLPGSDPRLIGADLEVASMQAALHRIPAARITYVRVEKDALAIGRPDLAALARVRSAWLHQLEGDTALARKKLRVIAEDRAPATALSRLTSLVLLARLDRKEGKVESSDALIAELKGAGFTRPTLLYSPPMQLHTDGGNASESGSTTRLLATDNFDDRWADVGFWVKPDGRVADAEILRESGKTNWMKLVLKSIEGRIYSPIKDGGEGSYRVERYSYTSIWADRTGTRLRQRSQEARVEFIDLTED